MRGAIEIAKSHATTATMLGITAATPDTEADTEQREELQRRIDDAERKATYVTALQKELASAQTLKKDSVGDIQKELRRARAL